MDNHRTARPSKNRRAKYHKHRIFVHQRADQLTAAHNDGDTDNETEHKITKAIEKISKDITVIIVAHRLSTVRHVDQLVYLSHGEIVSCGTFTEVQQQNEEFANLVRLGQLPE